MVTTRLPLGQRTFLACLAILHVIHGYPTGAPDAQCDGMTPGHGVAAQNGMSTYTITAPSMYTCGTAITGTYIIHYAQYDAMAPGHGVPAQNGMSTYTITAPSMYTCGTAITVTLGGASNFKGFFCQARTGANSNTRLGTFSIGTSTNMKLGCSSKAVTHNSNADKESVAFTWTGSEDHGNVYIVCTWVQNAATFWVKETSSMMTFMGNATECGGNSASHVTSRWFPYIVMAAMAVFMFK